MNTVREEVLDYIDIIPDEKLEALRPLLHLLADEPLIIETDLTDEEKRLIAAGMEEYDRNPDSFTPLSELR
jgi:hypothetical protein